jgi:hypothetical protein
VVKHLPGMREAEFNPQHGQKKKKKAKTNKQKRLQILEKVDNLISRLITLLDL